MTQPSPPRVFSDRYEIRRRIARGGMAEVFLARDLLLDRPVALKVLFPELSTDRAFVQRFRREAQAAANLNHPNIVSIYDQGVDDGTYFIVMEYVDGRTLSQVIRNEGPLLPDKAADIGAHVAAALAFAHKNGVVHRDIKPGNVLISDAVKVTDFGIARALNADENLTQTGAVMGTATYFSPEQAQGLEVDPRSDVYSLGVVLYEMVVGEPPFTGDNPMAIAYKHVRETPVPPRQRNPGIPEAFEAIVLQAMAKNPADRYASAEELRADLRRFRQGRSVMASPTAAMAAAARSTVAQPTVTDGATRAVPAGAAETQTVIEETEPVDPRKTGAYVFLLFGLLAALLGVLFLLARSVGLFDAPAATRVKVPNVVGLKEAEAKSTLEALGLTPNVVQEQTDAADPGVVFKQNPAPDVPLDKGASVDIFVATGVAPVEVPDVTGLTEAAARATLEEAGFTVTVEPRPDEEKPKGEVLDQDPKGGEQRPKGDPVTIVVSSGKGKVKVPDVIGKDADDAGDILRNAGLKPVYRREASNSVPKDKVIRTDPPRGADVDPDSAVTVIVSDGPDDVEVPSVVGMSEADAKSRLEAAGFNVSVVRQTAPPANDGKVIDQSPDAGQRAARGSTVTITVGRLAPATTAPATTSSSTP